MFLGIWFTKKREIHTANWSVKLKFYWRFLSWKEHETWDSVCVPFLNERFVCHPYWLALCSRSLYCVQLRENDLITQTEWEQSVQTHTLRYTLCASLPSLLPIVLLVREPNRGQLVLKREVNSFFLKWANKTASLWSDFTMAMGSWWNRWHLKMKLMRIILKLSVIATITSWDFPVFVGCLFVLLSDTSPPGCVLDGDIISISYLWQN